MGKLAFVFPGQGSQYVGMGKSLYDGYTAAREVYDLCSDNELSVNGLSDNELSVSETIKISWEGPKEEQTATNIAQPAIFMADLAAAFSLNSALNKGGITVAGAAGFSLGEVPALAFSGLLDLKESFNFVRFRAKAMHLCTQENRGGMMAVMGLSEETVEGACASVEGAYPVNYNAPGQIVVAHQADASDKLKAAITSAKGKVMPLPVAGAFHSPMMDKAAEKISAYLADIKFGEMTIPLYANVTGKLYDTKDPKKLLATQVNSPVRWQGTIEQMIADGYDTFIETGPGKTLTGMIKKIDKNVRTFNVFDAESLEAVLAEF